ncbi:hypothetical protein SAMN04488020_11712 [Palleronia marisminoris]|uniref:Uncharacterized protein n=1 Tax=Palleronia marisminoris TaxID=315423 RepID=A0A1Y5TTS5_9RHOB|nr:hypothetical protein SAMN04488020_11712 [Palleronia marisminoris]SLN69504.1 hypothetical protein PAM7066_03513 [Palleronia marisminoris]
MTILVTVLLAGRIAAGAARGACVARYQPAALIGDALAIFAGPIAG